MADVRPELIFVEGPQKGHRAVLMKDTMVFGRLGACDVVLKDEAASRQHLRFTRTGDGWIVENLSSNGTFINEKRYKGGKRIMLDTGDVVGAGAATRMLFVAAGDDPDKALQAYLQSGLAQQAPAFESQAVDAQAGEPAHAGSDASNAPATHPLGPTTAPLSPDEEAAAAKRKKLRKYAVYFGIYFAFMIGFIAVLATLRSSDETTDSGGSPRLFSDTEISELLRRRLERPANPALAAESLEKARMLYRDRNLHKGNLYKAAKYYKLHLAYARKQDFDAVADAQSFANALDELVTTVCAKYRNAYALQRTGDWRRANAEFGELMAMVPTREPPEPEKVSPLFDNIRDHLTYIRQNMRRR